MPRSGESSFQIPEFGSIFGSGTFFPYYPKSGLHFFKVVIIGHTEFKKIYMLGVILKYNNLSSSLFERVTQSKFTLYIMSYV